MEQFLSLAVLDRAVATTAFIAIAIAVITDKLVWHTRLKKANDRADRWEAIAIEALTGAASTSVRTAEVAVDVVASLPDPQNSGKG